MSEFNQGNPEKRPRTKVESGTETGSPARKLLSRQPTIRGHNAPDNVFNIGSSSSSSSRMAANDPLSSPRPVRKSTNVDPETPPNNPNTVINNMVSRQKTDNRLLLRDAGQYVKGNLYSMTSPETKVTVNRNAIKEIKRELVASTVEEYIRSQDKFAGKFDTEIKKNIPDKDTEEQRNKINTINTIIDNYHNKGTIKKYLNQEFEEIDNLEDLIRIYFIYKRSPETKNALQVLGDSDEIGEEALKKQQDTVAVRKFFDLFEAANAKNPPPPPFVLKEEEDEDMDTSFSQYDYEAQEHDKAIKLKKELLEIVKSNLQTNLDEQRVKNYELDPEKVDYLKDENVDNRNEKIINEIMKESDDQTTITRDGVTIAHQPSELAQLASSLGEKYISLNLKGGPKVKIDGIGDSSVVEEDDTNEYVAPVIIGTEYVEKSTEETDDEKEKKEEEMKKKEHELIVEQDTAKGPIKRSSRLAKASDKLKEINDQLLKQQEQDKKKKKSVKKKEFYYKDGKPVDGKPVDGTSALLSVSGISSIASNLILEFLNKNSEIKITIHDLIAGDTPGGASSIYSNLLYEACLLRNLPSQLQHVELERVKPAEARDAASTGIAEKTQFSDIWGPWVFNYASTQSNLNGEYEDPTSVDGNAEKVKCYICKQFLVPFSEKSDWGSKGKRSCSEMEHTLPCITAFTQAPTYVLLDRYKHNGTGYLKLWKKFTEREDDANIYNYMKELYKMINEEEIFNKPVIEQNLKFLMTKFEQHCLTFGGPVHEDTFNWVIEVIKYWLFEFSYAHHICNQVKSNRDIEQSNEMTRYLNDTENRWRGSLDKKGKKVGQDNIDIVEARSIDASRNITLERDKIKKNLKARFDMMRVYSGKKGKIQTEGTIRQNYKNITSIKIKPEELDKDKDDIMSIMVTKGLILMYKHYKKEQLKKDKKESSSSSKFSSVSKSLLKNSKQSTLPGYMTGTASSMARERKPPRRGRGGTIKRKQNRRNQRTIKRKQKKNRKQRTIKRKQNKRKQRTIKKQKKR